MWCARPAVKADDLTIRAVRPEDVDDLVALEVALVEDGRGQVRTPADLPPAAVYREELLARMVGRGWLVVEVDGIVVASGSITQPRPSMVRHLGSFEIGVHPAHQGAGIGGRLARALIAQARAMGVQRLSLSVREDNLRAIALYEALGFVTEVVRDRYVRLPDGRFVDDRSMVLWLDDGWPASS